MRTEFRFLVAMLLMVGVIVGTNLLFPPTLPELPLVTESEAEGGAAPAAEDAPRVTLPAAEAKPSADEPASEAPGAGPVEDATSGPAVARTITVESPLYRFQFSTVGAVLQSAELLGFKSFQRDGPVQLIPEDGRDPLSHRLLIGSDTLDLRSLPFEASPSGDLRMDEGTGPRTLTFVYQHPSQNFAFEVIYTFDPATYQIAAEGKVTGADGALVMTDLGSGIAANEADAAADRQAFALVSMRDRGSVEMQRLAKSIEPGLQNGPYHWVAFKSKFFVTAILAEGEEAAHQFGGLITGDVGREDQVDVVVTQALQPDGSFRHRLFLAPQEHARLASIGEGLEDVNPYGWRFLRPVLKPITNGIMWLFVWMHENLRIGYGWVLIVFGVAMRVVLWPLNQKAMRAQLRNMAVQPMIKEIQAKYKSNPEKLQKEMMRLYKEEGFNPVAGCLPMLLPWPVLIALFFVFQNTISLRGVPFGWLPDLSAPDPLFILPIFLGVSMFALQWISMRSIPDANPQMKIMMWFMPFFMVVIFFKLASGLNLYYATANIAMLPQQYWIANERKKAQQHQKPAPVKEQKAKA